MKVASSRPMVLLLLALLLFPNVPLLAAVPSRAPAAAPRDVVINEIGWAGTPASTADEWIELYNNTDGAIDLTGWTLTAADGAPSITLSGSIPAHGYYLLERTDDTTIIDIPADWIGSFGTGLGNTGEALTLRDAADNIIDTANGDGGAWPAGTTSPNFQSMERVDPLAPDADANWASNTTAIRNGHAANGAPLNGTPKLRNSASSPAADLLIAKSAPTQASAGSDIVYGLRLGNWGNLAGAAGVVTDTLPAGVSFVSQVSPYPYAEPTPGVIVWSLDAVPYTLTTPIITLTGHIALTATGTLANEARIASASPEVTTTNNAAWAYTLVLGEYANLVAHKAGPATAAPDSPVTYTLVISSAGALPATAVRVTDTLPAGVAFVTALPFPDLQPAPNTLVWTVGDLPPGTQALITLYGAVRPTATGTLTNVVTASTTAAEANLSDNTASWRTSVSIPGEGYVVINEVAWGGTGPSPLDADEWIELYNPTANAVNLSGWTLVSGDGSPNIALVGTIPAHGYFLLERTDDTTVDDIPADQIYTGALGNAGETLTLRDAGGSAVDTANGDGGEWPAGTASPNYQSMERIDCTLPDSDANWASNDMVTRNGHNAQGGPINGTPKARNSASLPPPSSADLAMGKSGPSAVSPGDPIAYTLTIANAGNIAATSVRITDTLPAGVFFVAQSSPFPFTQAGTLLIWDAGSLAPAAPETWLVTGTVAPTASGTLRNQVYATTAVTEVNMSNNLAWVDTLVQVSAPDLAVSKAGPATARVGGLVQYALEVRNIGALEAPDAVLTDTLPAGVLFLSSSYTATQSGRDIVWRLGTLAAGASVAIDLYGQVAPTATGTVTNLLLAATAAAEPNLGNNGASWDTDILPANTGHVVINEVAWSGTGASTADEWIELYNAGGVDVDLSGWTLNAADGVPAISLAGVIPAGGYYLLERTDDTTIIDIPADWIGSFGTGLSNDGEALTLRDAGGNIVDTANGDGGAWPAGTEDADRRSMERRLATLPDSDANWASNDMVTRNGHDANNGPINGTPKARNSAVPPPAPDLAVDKTGPFTTTPGAQFTYILAISNVGDLAAPDARITDTLPTGVSFVSQSSTYPLTFQQVAPNVLVWTAGVVPTATYALIVLHVQVESGAPAFLRNAVVASTTVPEMSKANNRATWDTRVAGGSSWVFLPLLYKEYRLQVQIAAVLYDGYQSSDTDEAVRLVNRGTVPVRLDGWSLAKEDTTPGTIIYKPLPAGAVIPPGETAWFARNAAGFQRSFGFAPDYTLDSWFAGLDNNGDEVLLYDGSRLVDAVVFEGSAYAGPGWSGATISPYKGSWTSPGAEGQVLQRRLDEGSGEFVPDTDTARDWMSYPDDASYGRRALYPGWDLEQFYRPLSVTEYASLTVAVAPDAAAELVLQAIGGAQRSIEAEFYQLEQYTIALALADKAREGVSVTLLLEGQAVATSGGITDQERWACQQIGEAGGACWFMFYSDTLRIFDRYTYIHSKVMLIDREWALISSQNPTGGGMPGDNKADGTWGSRGVLLLTNAPSVVARLGEIFDADLDPAHNDVTRWDPANPYGYGLPPVGFQPLISTGGSTSTVQFPAPRVITGNLGFEVISAPESSLRQSDSLLGLLKRAGPGDTILVEQMYEYGDWGDMPDGSPAPNLRLESYIAAARRGARVRILLNSGAFGMTYLPIEENAATLVYVNNLAYCAGLDLQVHLGNPTGYGLHNKLVLAEIGGVGYAHIGSINGSEASSKVNREIAVNLRSDEAYRYLAEMFEWDWAQSAPLLISEVMYNPENPQGQNEAGREWVEIFNQTDQPIDLAGWQIGDAAALGEYGSGRYLFPAVPAAVIPPHGLVTIAGLAQLVPFAPTFEFVVPGAANDPAVPDMQPVVTPWEGFGFSLGNTNGDKVLLLDPSGKVVDAAVYCGSEGCPNYPGVVPFSVYLSSGKSLERRPPERDTDNCSADFYENAQPTPGLFPVGYHDCGCR